MIKAAINTLGIRPRQRRLVDLAMPGAAHVTAAEMALIEAADNPDSALLVTELLPGRKLRLLAGFYADQSEALGVAELLRDHFHLQPSQYTLLSPRHAESRNFSRHQRLWDRRRERAKPSVVARLSSASPALLGVWIGAALALLWGATSASAEVDTALLALWLTLAGAVVGFGLTGLMPNAKTLRRRFDIAVQQKLAAGQSAVVLHGLEPADAVGAAELLRDSSVYWCAEAPRVRTRE